MAGFIYHLKPPSLRGDELLPLNQLRVRHPALYDEAFQKYLGREHLTEVKLPRLNCLWNDVLHFAPIHPSLIRKALSAMSSSPILDRMWLKIPVSALSGLPAVYFDSPPSVYGGNYDFEATCFRDFRIEEYSELRDLPKRTLEYYREQLEQEKRPLLFNGVTHVLVKGMVSVVKAEEFVW